MKKLGFVYSGLLVLIGIIINMFTRIINLILPKAGLIAFKIAAAGSYAPDEYIVNFRPVNAIATVIGIIGLILAVIFYYSETRLDDVRIGG